MRQWFMTDETKLFAKFAGISKKRAERLLDEHGEFFVIFDGSQLQHDLTLFRDVAKKAGIPCEQWRPKKVAEHYKKLQQESEE